MPKPTELSTQRSVLKDKSTVKWKNITRHKYLLGVSAARSIKGIVRTSDPEALEMDGLGFGLVCWLGLVFF